MWNDRYVASIALIVMAVLLSARESSRVIPPESIPQIELKSENTSAFSSPDAHEFNPPINEATISDHNPFALRVMDVSLNKRQTLGQKLLEIGVSRADVERALKVINPVCALRNIASKQRLTLTFDGETLQKLSFYTQRDRVVVERGTDKLFHASKKAVPLQLERLEGAISTSLHRSLKALNVSQRVTNEAIQAMSAAVDPRQIRPGNRFVILVETGYDDSGNKLPMGGVCALAFHNGKKWSASYRFDHKGHSSFLNTSGQGSSASRLIMPVSVKRMRISGKFGLRHHPIRGYTCQHKGIDLAAPVGTPVMSAADGVVVKACYWGAYGKYILVRHAGGYSTAYAHLSHMVVKPGDRVKQHQVIGKVGLTGLTTGAHLHYEVHQNNKHINPLTVVSLPAAGLNRQEMKTFQVNRSRLDALLKI